jgi:hypothetical protein
MFVPKAEGILRKHKIPWINKKLQLAINAKRNLWYKVKATSGKVKHLIDKYKEAKRLVRVLLRTNR